MSDALIWLGYALSAALAFAAVHYKSWRIVPAMLAGAVAGLVVAVLGILTTTREDRSPWETVEITLNGSVCLLFAALGAAIAFAIRDSRDPSE